MSRIGFALVVGLVISAASGNAADVKYEDVLARHLQSLGPAEKLTAAKTRIVQGAAVYRLLVGGSGQLPGKAVLVSEGPKTHMLLKVVANQYSGERFICNGDKTSVAATYADKTYSDFGEFLRGQDAAVREGLLGGVLTTAWPLLNLQARKATISYEGLKKIDGRELHALRYKPKKNTDLDILLYFEPDTFHHVMSVYTASIEPRIGFNDVRSARRIPSHYRIEERFSDFQTTDGLTLPSHYDLRFTQEPDAGVTKSVEWDITVGEITNNASLDPRNFEIH